MNERDKDKVAHHLLDTFELHLRNLRCFVVPIAAELVPSVLKRMDIFSCGNYSMLMQ